MIVVVRLVLSRVGPTALAAFAAHTALWGTPAPHDTAHAYFGWYEPLVAALAGAGLLVLLGMVLCAALARTRLRLRRALSATVTPAPPAPAMKRLTGVAGGGVALLWTQETIEQSLFAGHLAVATFTATSLIAVVAAALGVAALVVLVERGLRRLYQRLLRSPARLGHAKSSPSWRPAGVFVPRRRSPLSSGCALRAPPRLIA